MSLEEIVEVPSCAVASCTIPAFYQQDDGTTLCSEHARERGTTDRVYEPVLRYCMARAMLPDRIVAPPG